MCVKKFLVIAFLNCLSLNLFAQIEVKPIFNQVVSINSEHPYFEIINLDLFPDNELLVYNRWGNEVYKASPYMGKWNCTSKGKNSNDPEKLIESGTYFYIFKDKKTQTDYQGYFNFLR